MNSCFIKSLVLITSLSTVSFFSIATDTATQSPQIFIKTIHNTTPYNILLVDKLAKNKSILLPIGQSTEVNFIINNNNAVILNGSMTDNMSKQAQYVFKKLDQDDQPELNQEVYFNLHTAPGGVSNGGITVGTPGSTILHFYVAGKNGGCMMNSGKIDTESQIKEFELALTMNKKDIQANIFKVAIDGHLIHK